jgi:hypothetical protein
MLKCLIAFTSICVRTLEIFRRETSVIQPQSKLEPTPKALTLLITFQSKETNYRQTQLVHILYAVFWQHVSTQYGHLQANNTQFTKSTV